ncbi:MAG: hypothetical protein IPM91_00830 [Bacteroidetes bacterium]|nr:hypothetical protein [Bacteroidota bacterium]
MKSQSYKVTRKGVFTFYPCDALLGPFQTKVSIHPTLLSGSLYDEIELVYLFLLTLYRFAEACTTRQGTDVM